MYGRTHSEEAKKKMSQSAKERYEENDHPMKGKGFLGVWKEKFERKKKKHYKKVSKTMTGVPKTEEHRKNIRKSIAQKK